MGWERLIPESCVLGTSHMGLSLQEASCCQLMEMRKWGSQGRTLLGFEGEGAKVAAGSAGDKICGCLRGEAMATEMPFPMHSPGAASALCRCRQASAVCRGRSKGASLHGHSVGTVLVLSPCMGVIP